MTVYYFDPQPPPRAAKPQPDAPFFVGLRWGMAIVLVFYTGLAMLMHACGHAVFGQTT